MPEGQLKQQKIIFLFYRTWSPLWAVASQEMKKNCFENSSFNNFSERKKETDRQKDTQTDKQKDKKTEAKAGMRRFYQGQTDIKT